MIFSSARDGIQNIPQLASKLQQIFEDGRWKQYDESEGYFYQYHGGLQDLEHATKYILMVKGLLGSTIQNIQSRVTLDVGCGFGITSTIMALLGAKEVYGIDMNKEKIETFRNYLFDLFPTLAVKPKVADAANMDLAKNSFDIILVHEALSHMRYPLKFLENVIPLLKRNGMLIISDANNARNPKRVKETYRFWSAVENGPSKVFNFMGQPRDIKITYLEMRKKIIRKNFDFDDNVVDKIATGTSFMDENEIIDS